MCQLNVFLCFACMKVTEYILNPNYIFQHDGMHRISIFHNHLKMIESQENCVQVSVAWKYLAQWFQPSAQHYTVSWVQVDHDKHDSQEHYTLLLSQLGSFSLSTLLEVIY